MNRFVEATTVAMLMLVFLLAMSQFAYGASPKAEARARAIVDALSTGDPVAYEKVAQANFTAALYERRTRVDRAGMLAQVHGQMGSLTVETIDWQGETLTIVASGNGRKLRIDFEFAVAEDDRIAKIGIDFVGRETEESPALPPLNLNAGMSPVRMSAEIDQWVSPMAARDDFSGVILIARKSNPLVFKAWGLADREHRTPVHTDTAFNIASIGKKFTQTVIARLVEQRKLTLATTIGDVLPDYPNAEARAATVQQLVDMQGGIADFFGPGFGKVDKASLNSNHGYYLYVSSLPQRFKPGTSTEYCNGCYIVLGEMAERLTGQSFESNVAEMVFRPAGMTRSGYFRANNLPENTARGYGHVRGPKAPYEDTRAFHGETGSGAGGVYATATDLLAFNNALREGRLLKPDMTAWVLSGDKTTGRNPASLGIAGGAPGANSILESWDDWAVIVLANVDPQLPETMGVRIAKALR